MSKRPDRSAAAARWRPRYEEMVADLRSRNALDFYDLRVVKEMFALAEWFVEAGEADAARRRDKPTRAELVQAFDAHCQEGEPLTPEDARHIRDLIEGKPLPTGRPKTAETALLGRDVHMYFDYKELLDAGHTKARAKRKIGLKFGVSSKTVEATITRTHRWLAHPRGWM